MRLSLRIAHSPPNDYHWKASFVQHTFNWAVNSLFFVTFFFVCVLGPTAANWSVVGKRNIPQNKVSHLTEGLPSNAIDKLPSSLAVTKERRLGRTSLPYSGGELPYESFNSIGGSFVTREKVDDLRLLPKPHRGSRDEVCEQPTKNK